MGHYRLPCVVFTILVDLSICASISSQNTYYLDVPPDGVDIYRQTISLSRDQVFHGQVVFDGTIPTNTTCEMTLDAGYGGDHRLMFHLAPLDTHSGNCTDPHLAVYDGGSADGRLLMHNFPRGLCNYTAASETLTTSGPYLTLQYVGDLACRQPASWAVVFTVFHTGRCMSYEYRCANDRCIDHSLNCGGGDPCGDGSDCRLTPAGIAAIALGGVGVLAFTGSLVFVCCKGGLSMCRSRPQRQPNKFRPSIGVESTQLFTLSHGTVTRLTSSMKQQRYQNDVKHL